MVAPTPLSPCSSCGERSAFVIESRIRPDGSRRRRLACQACGHRFTTYEVYQDDYQRLQSAAARLAAIEAALAPLALSNPPEHVIPCAACTYGGLRCSFDYPEFRTRDAYDCVMYSTSVKEPMFLLADD